MQFNIINKLNLSKSGENKGNKEPNKPENISEFSGKSEKPQIKVETKKKFNFKNFSYSEQTKFDRGEGTGTSEKGEEFVKDNKNLNKDFLKRYKNNKLTDNIKLLRNKKTEDKQEDIKENLGDLKDKLQSTFSRVKEEFKKKTKKKLLGFLKKIIFAFLKFFNSIFLKVVFWLFGLIAPFIGVIIGVTLLISSIIFLVLISETNTDWEKNKSGFNQSIDNIISGPGGIYSGSAAEMVELSCSKFLSLEKKDSVRGNYGDGDSKIYSIPLGSPVNSYVTQGYGERISVYGFQYTYNDNDFLSDLKFTYQLRGGHKGVDTSVNNKQDIIGMYSTNDGYVEKIILNPGTLGYGTTIEVASYFKTPSGEDSKIISKYSHLDFYPTIAHWKKIGLLNENNEVQSNFKINAGDLVGFMGNTGFSTAKHLDYEIRIFDPETGKGAQINPSAFMLAKYEDIRDELPELFDLENNLDGYEDSLYKIFSILPSADAAHNEIMRRARSRLPIGLGMIQDEETLNRCKENSIFLRDNNEVDNIKKIIYYLAATSENIPPAVLVALHYRERGWGLVNPGTNNSNEGLYGFNKGIFDQAGNLKLTGCADILGNSSIAAIGTKVTYQEFYNQSRCAARIFKSKISAFMPENPIITKTNYTDEQIQIGFARYNGFRGDPEFSSYVFNGTYPGLSSNPLHMSGMYMAISPGQEACDSTGPLASSIQACFETGSRYCRRSDGGCYKREASSRKGAWTIFKQYESELSENLILDFFKKIGDTKSSVEQEISAIISGE